jgi:tetratricopeptide (TPR) repeat protein
MSAQLVVLIVATIGIVWLVLYMRAQKPADDNLQRGEALRLEGKFDEAIEFYRRSNDPAAREAIALSLAHAGRDLDTAKRLMDETIALHPQIMEFQSLALAYILFKRGDRDDALRIYRDNAELLETRFRDDYTDPDPQLAETLFMYATLADANGETDRANELRGRAGAWAPGSVWARGGTLSS